MVSRGCGRIIRCCGTCDNDDDAGACTACAPARCSPCARDLDDDLLWNERAIRTLDPDGVRVRPKTGATTVVLEGCCSCSCTSSPVSNNAM
jgi:hypothetical protein